MSVLADVKADGRILYAIALENYRTGFAGFLYMHGFSKQDVVNQLLRSNQLRKDTRVAWIAPAVGVKVDLNERDEVKQVIV